MHLGEDDGRTTQERAQAEYQSMVRWSRKLHGQGSIEAEVDSSYHLGQNVLREETGFFGPWEGAGYSFDKPTQDRLLAHTRQDVAATNALASAAFRQAYRARRMTELLFYLLVVLIVMNAAALGLLAALWIRG